MGSEGGEGVGLKWERVNDRMRERGYTGKRGRDGREREERW